MSKIIVPNKSEEIQHEKNTFPNFLTISEFVEATKVSRQTINRKLKLKEIPYAKIGSRILIPISFLFSLEKKAYSVLKTMNNK